MRGSRWLWLLVTIVAAGCASSASSGSAGTFNSSAVVSWTTCTEVGAAGGTGTLVRPCVFVLGDGRRFSCPPAFAHRVQTATTLEHGKGCHPLSPLAIPVSWRPGLAALQRAGACFTDQGLRVSGGPSLGAPSHGPQTPIGELFVQHGNAPIFVAYYESAQAAQRFEPIVAASAKRFGGRLARAGRVIVLWTRPPTNSQRKAVEACAFV